MGKVESMIKWPDVTSKLAACLLSRNKWADLLLTHLPPKVRVDEESIRPLSVPFVSSKFIFMLLPLLVELFEFL